MTLDDIKQAIPHRDPFLWLDEVVSISETRIVARKHLPADLDLFRGHYPHFPILPGVIQCEAAFQASAVLISRLLPTGTDMAPVVTRLNNVQFRAMVRPNQTIEMEVELTERLQNTFYLKGKVTCEGKVSCRLEFACTATEIAKEG
jgi:3-hydroxyacyl-[acyl-carrier-protein] dehydratase